MATSFCHFSRVPWWNKNGLADLTDFVRTSSETNWTDVFRFNRDVQAVYDNAVRLLP